VAKSRKKGIFPEKMISSQNHTNIAAKAAKAKYSPLLAGNLRLPSTGCDPDMDNDDNLEAKLTPKMQKRGPFGAPFLNAQNAALLNRYLLTDKARQQ
jgi:hypothetical protein